MEFTTQGIGPLIGISCLLLAVIVWFIWTLLGSFAQSIFDIKKKRKGFCKSFCFHNGGFFYYGPFAYFRKYREKICSECFEKKE